MNFLFSFINFIGLLLYGISILGVIRALCTYDTFKKRSEWKNTLLVFILVIIAPICGYMVREYAQGKKRIIYFNEVIDRELSRDNTNHFSLLNIRGAFSKLKDYDKGKVVEFIFNKFYDNNLQGRCNFLNEYKDYDIPYVAKIKTETEAAIEQIYINIENTGDSSQWRTISKRISIKDFLSNAPQNIIEKEFSKWDNDSNAWERVILLDSIYLSKIYLDRYPNGRYECIAKRIILDNEYSKSEGRDRKISSNYCGTTTISIINRSSYEAVFSYDGSFDKGSIKIPGYGQREVRVRNGYYRISISSQKLHTKGIHERITCDGGYIPYDIELKQDYR